MFPKVGSSTREERALQMAAFLLHPSDGKPPRSSERWCTPGATCELDPKAYRLVQPSPASIEPVSTGVPFDPPQFLKQKKRVAVFGRNTINTEDQGEGWGLLNC